MTDTSDPIGLLAETCLIYRAKTAQNMISIFRGMKLFELASYFYAYCLFINGNNVTKDLLYNYALQSIQYANLVIEAGNTEADAHDLDFQALESPELHQLFHSCYKRRLVEGLQTLQVQGLTQNLAASQLPAIIHSSNLRNLCGDIANEDPELKDLLNWFYCASMILAIAIGFYRKHANSANLAPACLLAAKHLLNINTNTALLPVIDNNMQMTINKLLKITYGEEMPT